MSDRPINNLMDTTLDKLKQMVDVNTVIGTPITTPDGTTIIPVSKVIYGFASGGSEFNSKKPDSEVGSVLPLKFREDLFGDPSKLIESDINPEVLYKKIKKQGKEAPFIYLAIGIDDNLLETNRAFRDFLKKEKADFFYEEGPGRHTWQFWNEYIDRGLKTVLNR